MRIHILSDIHDDYSRASLGNYAIPQDLDVDLIVVAGDIAGRLSRMGRTWLEHQRQRTGTDIVLIAGNHDYWRASLDREVDRFRDRLQCDGIHILDGEAIEIGGVRFVGGTLWTDYEILDGDGYHGQRAALEEMNDYRFIRARDYERRLLPWMLREEHARHRAAIETVLSTPFAGPTVVVTHHAPSPKSLRGGEASTFLDGAYASDLEPMICRYQPDLWIHGHVHERKDYVVGSTRILCNPRGYRHAARRHRPAEIEVGGFDPRLVVEVEERIPLDGVHGDVGIGPGSEDWFR
ncbi:metallophosphoesterase [Aurantimonas sp. MSK8Z-1]|uniref:metallophosphoesterase n=1 Tax=Mangrovibrevibacter kandeliae TaxID=2968473 RepID=UPI002118AA39|nr:metallophosphoesterase [Aurantimonas sp. MSK8Z-1]MCW4114368.1 metallophosphoesterase [Aurantimonas sp. MSK8Z-1]